MPPHAGASRIDLAQRRLRERHLEKRCHDIRARGSLAASRLQGGPMTINSTPAETPVLAISPDKVCFLIDLAHEIDANDFVNNPSYAEAKAFIDTLSEDEQIDLVTLAWVGRDDNSIDDWDDLRAEAVRAHNERTAGYLLGMPLLADQLEEALEQFGLSCEE
jgi:Protein of unknown function (DUF3775)